MERPHVLFEHDVKIAPQNARMRKNYGGSFARLAVQHQTSNPEQAKQYARSAIEQLSHALQLYPKIATGHIHSGNMHIILGQYDEAIKSLEAALQIDPNNYYAKASLGNVHFRKGNYEQSIQVLESIPRHLRKKGDLDVLARNYDRLGNAAKASEIRGRPIKPNTMEEKLAHYIAKHQLIAEGEKILIAVSGGVDSMVLCHLFKKLNIEFGIAHCNFKLRGNDSNEDEIFVNKMAEKLSVPFFTKSFDTENYAAQKKISIQEAARDLRYDWLWKTCDEKGFDKLATAHHLDDNIETVLFNFAKGTGIRGMRGIFPKKNKLIRPLLFVTKKEVISYAELNEIKYHEDITNLTDKYSRNKIRHRITPVLEELNPSFQHAAGETIRHLREVEILYNHAIEYLKNDYFKTIYDNFGKIISHQIDIKKLLSSPAPNTCCSKHCILLVSIIHKPSK